MNVSHLQLVTSTYEYNHNFNGSPICSLRVTGLCSLSSDLLLLACGGAGLRAFSLDRMQLFPHELLIATRDGTRVAIGTNTDTLLFLVPNATENKW